jgi:hypothetical protein
MAAPGCATGETTLTDGTGLTVGAAVGVTVGAAVNEVPQDEQKAASSRLLAPHVGHFLTIFHFSSI